MSEDNPKVAYLGPLGTYSHQAAFTLFGRNGHYVEKNTIADVVDSISPDCPCGVIPQENTIFGPVIEAYDVLRSPRAGAEVFVRGEVTLAIQHCLVARVGIQRDRIRRVLSHEQALGQCTQYISQNYPDAALEKVTSTAAAAQALLNEDSADIHSAAICSAHCTSIFDGLQVLEESIQNSQVNYTRFYVLSNVISSDLSPHATPSSLRKALVRLSLAASSRSETVATDSLDTATLRNRPLHLVVSTLLTTFGVPIVRIDRRPSLDAVPFEDIYFIELEDLGNPSTSPHDQTLSDTAWLKRLQMGVDRVAAAGGEAIIVGVW